MRYIQRSGNSYYENGHRFSPRFERPEWIVWSTTGRMDVSGRHVGASHQGRSFFIRHPDNARPGQIEAIKRLPEWARNAAKLAWDDLAEQIDAPLGIDPGFYIPG